MNGMLDRKGKGVSTPRRRNRKEENRTAQMTRRSGFHVNFFKTRGRRKEARRFPKMSKRGVWQVVQHVKSRDGEKFLEGVKGPKPAKGWKRGRNQTVEEKH